MDNSFYTGYTNNLERRLEEHNDGKSRYTSKKIPWKIVYSEEFGEKSDAIKREFFLKKQKSREFYLYGNRKKIRRLKYQEDIDCPILLFFS
jgi:putative endonuclease